ncbi:hypothetical protein [Bacillus smithii]|uniref:hypothetical protein n=1 Tax=Bacillus smithii TaxID=1479 RepID=UPI002E1A3753|nr:hypothetical protein [Bacillus smithii]MED4929125.1 hypothetical protein [Bacillus smithii]
MSMADILGMPTYVDGVGDVHPIKVKDWDLFEKNANVLLLTKNHLPLNIEEDIPLLDRIVIGIRDEELVDSLCTIFNLVLKSNEFRIDTDGKDYFFINENNQIITNKTYEELRRVILRQNIIFEPKVYKDKLLQQWAEKVLEHRNKEAANITMEDMITTIAVLSGKHYWDIAEYTIYQLKSEFQRINKIKQYETTSILYANPYAAADVKLEHFAECLELYEDPYKGVFKSTEGSNISKAFKAN